VAGQLGAARAHPGLELRDERRDVLPAHGQALPAGQSVDGAFGVEDGVDAPHGLDGQRSARQLGQLK
jgi:hypothetical protein